jgi:hypothetical protein
MWMRVLRQPHPGLSRSTVSMCGSRLPKAGGREMLRDLKRHVGRF